MANSRCRVCGSQLPDKHRYCPQCGTKVTSAEFRPDARSPHEALPTDELIWEGTYSWKGAIRHIALATLATVALLVFAMVSSEPTAAWGAWLAVPAIWLAIAVWIAYRKMNVHYTLSEHRLRHRHGILYRRVQQMDVIDIDDLVLEQGLLEWLLGVGRIRVIGSDKTHARLTLAGIDKAASVFESMEQVRREERRRYGLHVEMV